MLRSFWTKLFAAPEPLPLSMAQPYLALMERIGPGCVWSGHDPVFDQEAQEADDLGLVCMGSAGTDGDYWQLTRLGEVTLERYRPKR